jgi:hypothetical protein
MSLFVDPERIHTHDFWVLLIYYKKKPARIYYNTVFFDENVNDTEVVVRQSVRMKLFDNQMVSIVGIDFSCHHVDRTRTEKKRKIRGMKKENKLTIICI